VSSASGTRTMLYFAGCGSVVPKRALTAYRCLPCAAIVVGTSNALSVIVRTIVPCARSGERRMTAIWFRRFWTTNRV
jgi:hypothetical protein